MFYLKMADFNICVHNKYDYVEDMCGEYVTHKCAPDFEIKINDEDINAEQHDGNYPLGYLESLAVYRKIANKIIEHDGFLMHGVLIEAEGIGIAFLAKSGTGKSTHASLWQKLLGERMTVINGDKPIVRIFKNEIYAYGTPWAGKEKIQKNKKVILNKICFIERSENNQCIKLKNSEVAQRLLSQIYMPKSFNLLVKTFDLINTMVNNVDFYLVKCDTNTEAAKTAYEVMKL